MIRSTIIVLSLLSGSFASLLQARGCDADNCARAITGTRFAPSIQASHTADCSSFMIESIISANAPTITTTITITDFVMAHDRRAKRTAAAAAPRADTPSGVPVSAIFASAVAAVKAATPVKARVAEVAAREVLVVTSIPTLVPTYASACSGTSRYSSACSCAGITRTTTSLATVTSTVITTTTATACDPNNNYGLIYINGYTDPNLQSNIGFVQNSSPAACCALCFSADSPYPGCWGYEMIDNFCLIGYELGGPNAPTQTCPYGIYDFTDWTLSTGANFGQGPCLDVIPNTTP
ncbi:hypothetical protein G7Y89_g9779 [Cudoniella acicularis]|uniref:Apple domain-containing protein n=1 Tax=Cudoniella acicularis TaxID=354080 RepID=A0A8H4RHP7_9HELO|nr:hypothetical protein G7Y89_g9779 [Cudoniella acicularis]